MNLEGRAGWWQGPSPLPGLTCLWSPLPTGSGPLTSEVAWRHNGQEWISLIAPYPWVSVLCVSPPETAVVILLALLHSSSRASYYGTPRKSLIVEAVRMDVFYVAFTPQKPVLGNMKPVLFCGSTRAEFFPEIM